MPMDHQQRRPDGQTLIVGVVAGTPGGNWLIAGVDDWQCLRQECSSPPNNEVLCTTKYYNDKKCCYIPG